MSNSLKPYGLQPTRLPCPSLPRSLLKLMSTESVIPSHHLVLCHPLLLLSSIFPSIRVFSSESALCQVAKVLELQVQHQSFHWIFRVDFLWDWPTWSPCSRRDSQESISTTIQKRQFFGAQPSLWSNTHICTWLLGEPQLWLYGTLSAKWCLCFLIHCLSWS